MPENYNPASFDAVLSRIEQKLTSMDEETQRYRAEKGAFDASLAARVGSLEGDKKKLMGVAIGSGIGAGSLGTIIHKLFGQP